MLFYKYGAGKHRKWRHKIASVLPVLKWSRRYRFKDLVADLLAGTTVGMTVVPQSIAYAAIAGLQPQFGLYSAYVGPLLYAFMGSTKEITIGPTAVMGLLTHETCESNMAECAVLTAFWVGFFQFLFIFLRLGCLINFISEPVTLGFTFSAAVIIMFSQIGNLLGIPGENASGFIQHCKFLAFNLQNFRLNDAILGLSSLLILMLLKRLSKMADDNLSRTCTNFIWFIATSKNAMIVVLTSLLAYLWPSPLFTITGEVALGLPSFKPPTFLLTTADQVPHSNASNFSGFAAELESSWTRFVETWKILGTGPLVIALISVMQNVAISKSFKSKEGVKANQEIAVLGISNCLGSFLSAFPVSASFSRSAVNASSGVRTPAGGIVTGIIVIMSLTYLTPSFYFIPKSSLAAVIISAVIFMGDFGALVSMWRISRIDFSIFTVTFAGCLYFGMAYGLFVGIALSLIILLLKTIRPSLYYDIKTDTATGGQYVYLEPHDGMQFSSISFICKNVLELVLNRYSHLQVVVLNFEKWSSWDYSSAMAFCNLYSDITSQGKIVVMEGCHQDWASALQHVGLDTSECMKVSYLNASLSEATFVASPASPVSPLVPHYESVHVSEEGNHHVYETVKLL